MRRGNVSLRETRDRRKETPRQKANDIRVSANRHTGKENDFYKSEITGQLSLHSGAVYSTAKKENELNVHVENKTQEKNFRCRYAGENSRYPLNKTPVS